MNLTIQGLSELRSRLERLRPEEIMATALADQAEHLAQSVRDGLAEPQGAGGHDKTMAPHRRPSRQHRIYRLRPRSRRRQQRSSCRPPGNWHQPHPTPPLPRAGRCIGRRGDRESDRLEPGRRDQRRALYEFSMKGAFGLRGNDDLLSCPQRRCVIRRRRWVSKATHHQPNRPRSTAAIAAPNTASGSLDVVSNTTASPA